MKNVHALALQDLYYDGHTDWDVSDEIIVNNKSISNDGWDDHEKLNKCKNTYESEFLKDDEWFRKMLRGGVKRIR